MLGFAGQYRVGNVQFISNLLSAFGALGNVDPLYLPSIYVENLNSLPSLCAHMHDSAWRGRCSRRPPPPGRLGHGQWPARGGAGSFHATLDTPPEEERSTTEDVDSADFLTERVTFNGFLSSNGKNKRTLPF